MKPRRLKSTSHSGSILAKSPIIHKRLHAPRHYLVLALVFCAVICFCLVGYSFPHSVRPTLSITRSEKRDLTIVPTRHAKWHLVTYADVSPYTLSQKSLDETMRFSGMHSHEKWSKEKLRQTSWFKSNTLLWKMYSELPRGENLLWAWKPFIILETMYTIPENDWIFYTDASKYFHGGFGTEFHSIITHLETLAQGNQGCTCIPATRLRQSLEWEFAQRCSLKNGANLCDTVQHVAPGESCDKLRKHPMVQASWSVWKNDPETRGFVKEWLALMMNFTLTRDLPFDDQTVLGLLIHIREMKTLWWPSAELMAWSEQGVKNRRRVYPSGGGVKCGTCNNTVAAFLKGEMSLVRGDARIIPGDWRPAVFKPEHLCVGDNPKQPSGSNNKTVVLGIYFNTPHLVVTEFWERSEICRDHACYYISSWNVVEHSQKGSLFPCDANVDNVYNRNGQQMHECYARFLDMCNAEHDVLFFHDDVIPLHPIASIIDAFRSLGPYPAVPGRVGQNINANQTTWHGRHGAGGWIDINDDATWKDGSWGLISKWNYGAKLKNMIQHVSLTDLDSFGCGRAPKPCRAFSTNADVLWVPVTSQKRTASLLHLFSKHGVGYDYSIGIMLAILSRPHSLDKLPTIDLLWRDRRKEPLEKLENPNGASFLHPIKVSTITSEEQGKVRRAFSRNESFFFAASERMSDQTQAVEKN